MTLSAKKGGENMSEEIKSGFVSFVHPNGYGFVECDDDDVEDSFIPPNLIKKHDLSANDQIEYIVGKSRGKDSVSEIISINNSVVIVKRKIPRNRPSKFSGEVRMIFSESGQGVIELDDYRDEILCNQKILKKHGISIGDSLEFSIKDAKYSTAKS